ncbi:MAG: 5'-methylthioadenosine phosphorylase [Myxococcota bacterium]
MSSAVILSSAFSSPALFGQAPLERQRFEQDGVEIDAFRVPRAGEDAWVLFRHGAPHRWLPHQVPYRAHARLLARLGVRSVLLTSSVGVMDPAVPENTPLVISDLLMLENRLPDGTACTVFEHPKETQGHLVLEEGIFSETLNGILDTLAPAPLPRVNFAYVGGPRTKTALENRYLAAAGIQTNSMSVGPEAVLLNELEIPVAALAVGHKRSTGEKRSHSAGTPSALGSSLERAKLQMETLVGEFLKLSPEVIFANSIYRFSDSHEDDR